jgi:hypothetical protein
MTCLSVSGRTHDAAEFITGASSSHAASSSATGTDNSTPSTFRIVFIAFIVFHPLLIISKSLYIRFSGMGIGF